MVGRERWLAGVTVAGIVLATALVCVLGLSDALPFGSDVALAAERVFGTGRDVPPVWGALVRLAWAVLPGEPAFRLGLVSALAGAAATGFVAGLAALEGLPGLVALPFVLCRSSSVVRRSS